LSEQLALIWFDFPVFSAPHHTLFQYFSKPFHPQKCVVKFLSGVAAAALAPEQFAMALRALHPFDANSTLTQRQPDRRGPTTAEYLSAADFEGRRTVIISALRAMTILFRILMGHVNQ
jgi:hypothetical protein